MSHTSTVSPSRTDDLGPSVAVRRRIGSAMVGLFAVWILTAAGAAMIGWDVFAAWTGAWLAATIAMQWSREVAKDEIRKAS